ncbi:MAG: CBS domain-containing protein [Thaumarchaeota archaeon]|nr:CBS domain-containing protein [Nitrososphaerota archaeon]
MYKRKISDIMTPLINNPLVEITPEKTVSDALDTIKETGKNKIIVVDENHRPRKTLNLIDIAGKKPNFPIRDLILDPIITVGADSEVDDNVKENLAKNKVIIAIGHDNAPVGILTAADLSRYWKYKTQDLS